MNSKLADLMAQYPVPAGWSAPELFSELASVPGLKVQLVGLSARRESGEMVTGSAAGIDENPLARAYFELLERVAIVEADKKQPSLFARSAEPNLYQYAKSNGVAAHTSLASARRSALLELVERDRVLRSWFGSNTPVPIRLPERSWTQALAEHYRFEAFEFPNTGPLDSTRVVGVFGFAKKVGLPRVYGFGASESREKALEKAQRECLQGLGFLWGESIPEGIPEFSPSPDYHQELYLSSEGIERVKFWLSGKHVIFGGAPSENASGEARFVDITPECLKGKIFVIKAEADGFIPLTFGACAKYAPAQFPRELLVHPIS